MADERIALEVTTDVSKSEASFRSLGQTGKRELDELTSAGDRSTTSLTGTERAGGRMTSTIRAAAPVVGTLVAAAGAYSAVGFAQNLINDADALQKMGLRVGESTESLSEMEFVLTQNGAKLVNFEKGIQNANRVVDEARQGSGEYVDILANLGLTWEDLEGKSPTETFTILQQQLSGITNDTELSTRAVEIFGARAGPQLVPTLKLGADGVRSLREEARALGVTVSQDFADDAATFNDTIQELTETGKALGRSLLTEMLPAMQQFLDLTLSITDAIGLTNKAEQGRAQQLGISLTQYQRYTEQVSLSRRQEQLLHQAYISGQLSLVQLREARQQLIDGLIAAEHARRVEIDAQRESNRLTEAERQALILNAQQWVSRNELVAGTLERQVIPQFEAAGQQALTSGADVEYLQQRLAGIVGEYNAVVNVGFNISDTILAELGNFFAQMGDLESAASVRGLYRAITRSAALQGQRGNLFGSRGSSSSGSSGGGGSRGSSGSSGSSGGGGGTELTGETLPSDAYANPTLRESAVEIFRSGKSLDELDARERTVLAQAYRVRGNELREGHARGSIVFPELATGGIVRARPGGTPVIVGEGGYDEAVIPLDRGGGLGMMRQPTVVYVQLQGDVYGVEDLDERVERAVNIGVRRGHVNMI